MGGPVWATELAHQDFSLVLPTGFVVAEAPELLDGQWSGGQHPASSGGWAIRSMAAAPYLEVSRRVGGRVDVDAALSADRFAMLALQEVQGSPGLHTLFVGPADGTAPQAGRWVFTAPTESGERLVWWHVYWRTPLSFVEFAAWAPVDQLPGLQQDIRQVEAAGKPSVAPTETLLFESGQQACGPTLRADRAAAIRDSRRFDDAREVLRESHVKALEPSRSDLAPAAGLRLAEHRAMGVLYRSTETCLHEVARAQRVCTVVEGQVKGASSVGLQAAVVACLDGKPKITQDVTRAVEAVWSSP
jgi:hypothetical protein